MSDDEMVEVAREEQSGPGVIYYIAEGPPRWPDDSRFRAPRSLMTRYTAALEQVSNLEDELYALLFAADRSEEREG